MKHMLSARHSARLWGKRTNENGSQPLRSSVRKHDQGLLTAWADGIIIEMLACWTFDLVKGQSGAVIGYE